MTLAERLAVPSTVRKGPSCSVSAVMENLSEDDRGALVAALENNRYTHKIIYEALIAEGHYVAITAIGRHRRSDCACSRSGEA